MDCIRLEGKVVHTRLLTHAEKIRKLESLFVDKRPDADLFLPDENFYGTTVSADDPERMADRLFKWLGIKHRSVRFHVNPNQNQLLIYTHEKNSSQLSLGLSALEDPFVCAATVAHGIIHHMLVARNKLSLGNDEENEALTDLGTIYAGFGILVLNSFEYRNQILGSMGAHNYANEFLDYCGMQRIVKTMWQPYVFPNIASTYLESVKNPTRLAPFLRKKLQASQKRKRTVLIFSGLLVTGICAIAAFNLSKPAELSAEMREKQETISILQDQYKKCTDYVAYKQAHWDQSDIFIQRQIQADKTRCASLKNRFNYEVTNFNTGR